METLTIVNGNKQIMNKELPKIIILTDSINDVALANIAENTDLNFVKTAWNYEAQPTNSNQITRLFLTYNFKTRYFDNWDYKNTLMLKFDHHVGFDVDSICFDCIEKNHIHTGDLKQGDRLSC